MGDPRGCADNNCGCGAWETGTPDGKRSPPQAAGLYKTKAMQTGTMERPLSSQRARRSAVSAAHLRRDLVAHGTSHIASCPAFATPQAPLNRGHSRTMARALTRLHRVTTGAIQSRGGTRQRDGHGPDARPPLHWWHQGVPRLRKIATAPLAPRGGAGAGPDSAPVLRRPDHVVQLVSSTACGGRRRTMPPLYPSHPPFGSGQRAPCQTPSGPPAASSGAA